MSATMNEQATLFEIPVGDEPEQRSIIQDFRRFHGLNPHVYHRLKEMALQLKSKGKTRYGMKTLFEVLRYQHDIQTEGDEFKLNNNYTALYSRLLMDNVPELEGFFETRERRTK